MIKAIPTEYKGVTYRSKIEARWAVFFDLAGIRVQYEDEAYELPSGRYLPDFYIPQLGVFFEVKPDNWEDFTEQGELHEATGRPVIVALGPPANNLEEYRRSRNGGFLVPISTYRYFGKVWGDCHGGGGMQEFYNVPAHWVEELTWGGNRWTLHYEPHKVNPEVLDETERLMVKALQFPFKRWMPPTAEAGVSKKTTKRPGDAGFFHEKFGVGIASSYSKDEYGREIVYATFPHGNGTTTPSPLLSSHVTFVDRKFKGWTKGAPERKLCARIINPNQYYASYDGVWRSNGEPKFFCLECEDVQSLGFAAERQGVEGWWIKVDQYEIVTKYYGSQPYNANELWTSNEYRISFYCQVCKNRLDGNEG